MGSIILGSVVTIFGFVTVDIGCMAIHALPLYQLATSGMALSIYICVGWMFVAYGVATIWENVVPTKSEEP